MVFLPWVTLPAPVNIAGFRFAPIEVSDPAAVVGSGLSGTVRAMLSSYIDARGKPIKSCTIVLRTRHSLSWHIPESLWRRVQVAADILAVTAMSSQRFFQQLSPHINATIFRPIFQGITRDSDLIALMVRRRGSSLKVGGYRFHDVKFQMPLSAYHTECPPLPRRFCDAVNRARTKRTPTWLALEQSLPLFLLGHAETPELPDEACVMLSAIALERLLETTGAALALSEKFTQLWGPYSRLKISGAKRIRADSKYRSVQANWTIHQKWAKELYEVRSSVAHRRLVKGYTQNWTPSQHLVIAAFVYPLLIKLRLAAESLYILDDKEMGACDALDELLDSDWGSGWKRPPEWPSILSKHEQSRALKKIIAKAFADTEWPAQRPK